MPPTLEDLPKDSLRTAEGVRYKDFRRELGPDFARTWAELLAGHAAVAGAAAGLVAAQSALGPLAAPLVPIGAAAIGCGMAYIQLFFHEAAHNNLAADRRTNDVLANLFIGSLVGQDIRTYRPIHMDHHRFLGTPEDPERTYFDPLNTRFLVESLTGIKLAKVMLGREKKTREKGAAEGKEKSQLNGQLLLGLALHGAVVGGAVLTGKWALAAGWVAGMAAGLPLFMAVRQVLEHRAEDASPDKDYAVEPHGEVHRMFGDGLLARVLGGAGFNRHLLHHFDPQLPYTRLADLESFLMKTPAAPVLEAAKTTYVDTLLSLLRAGSRRG